MWLLKEDSFLLKKSQTPHVKAEQSGTICRKITPEQVKKTNNMKTEVKRELISEKQEDTTESMLGNEAVA